MPASFSSSRFGVTALLAAMLAPAASAATMAYWRFEQGPADALVSKGAVPGGTAFHASVPDSSGNGNDLSVWETGGGAGFAYRANVGSAVIPQTGAANQFSIQNTGGGPAMFTSSTSALRTWTPSSFTFEASIRPENGGWRTFIGRDSQGAYAGDPNLAAMYFQITPDSQLAFKYVDLDGVWHEAVSASGLITGWNFNGGSPNDAPWQHVAAVSNGSTLTVYLDNGSGYTAVASSALGTGNTALSAGAGDGGDWDAGVFSVGRGLYGGGHGDRAYGLIDEIRISDVALSPSQFLNAIPEPGVGLLAALSLLGLRRRLR